MTPEKLIAPKANHVAWALFALSLITQHNFLKAEETLQAAVMLVPAMEGKALSLYMRAITALHTDRLQEIQA